MASFISKERCKEAIAGGIAAAAVVAVHDTVRAALSETTDADWLSFAGAMFGVLAAILIAVAIPRVQSARTDHIARGHIRDAAGDLIDSLDFSEIPAAQSKGRWARVMVGVERLAFERARLAHITHEQFFRLRGIERALESMDNRIAANPDLLDPLTYEFELGEHRDGAVKWLTEVDRLFAD